MSMLVIFLASLLTASWGAPCQDWLNSHLLQPLDLVWASRSLPAKKRAPQPGRILWLDLETSGLDEREHKPLEVAMVVTDEKLNILQAFQSVPHWSQAELNTMSSFAKEAHTKSGLLEYVARSSKSWGQVKAEMLQFLKLHFAGEIETRKAIMMAGNSNHFDLRFLRFHHSEFASHLSHSLGDVSALRNLLRTFKGVEFQKEYPHRAMDDVLNSIQELSTYLSILNKGLDSMPADGD
ncbi:MAG: oligoribonuclease [Bdellovibrio sp.]